MLNLENPATARTQVASLYEELFTGGPSRGNSEFTVRLLRSTFEIGQSVELAGVLRGAADLDGGTVQRIAELVSARVASPQGAEILLHRKFNGLASVLASASAVFGPRASWNQALVPLLVQEISDRKRLVRRKTKRHAEPKKLSRAEIQNKRAEFLESGENLEEDAPAPIRRRQTSRQRVDTRADKVPALSLAEIVTAPPIKIPEANTAQAPVVRPAVSVVESRVKKITESAAVAPATSSMSVPSPLDRTFPTTEERMILMRRWFEAFGTRAMSFDVDTAAYLLARAVGIEHQGLKSWIRDRTALSPIDASTLYAYVLEHQEHF